MTMAMTKAAAQELEQRDVHEYEESTNEKMRETEGQTVHGP